jgi:hypothetical protein
MASRKIGSLWRKQTKDGKVFYSGVIQDIRGDINIAVFMNDRKESEKHPDLNIVLSGDHDERKQIQEDPFFGSSSMDQSPAPLPEDEINVDDIPFE